MHLHVQVGDYSEEVAFVAHIMKLDEKKLCLLQL